LENGLAVRFRTGCRKEGVTLYLEVFSGKCYFCEPVAYLVLIHIKMKRLEKCVIKSVRIEERMVSKRLNLRKNKCGNAAVAISNSVGPV